MALRRAINTEVVLGVTTGDENTSPQLLDDDVSATGSPRAPSRRGARVPCVAGHIARARESPDVRMNPPSRAALSRLASAARSAGTRGPRSSLAFATPPSGAHPAPRIPNPRLGVSSDRRGFAAAAASAPNAPAAPAPKSNSWLGAALLLSPSLVCAFLCKWQVDRHHWKKGELAAREAALSAPELTLRELIALVDRGDASRRTIWNDFCSTQTNIKKDEVDLSALPRPACSRLQTLSPLKSLTQLQPTRRSSSSACP